MEYIYDIILNFQNEYYDFYEWYPYDSIINIKKLPIYKISSKDYLNLKYNEVTLNKEKLPKKDKIFLVTNGLEVMGIKIKENGFIIKRSSLIYEESDDILEDKDKIKKITLSYKINRNKKKQLIECRSIKDKINFIELFLNNNMKNEYLLKYIYYDIYNIEESNLNDIYNKLLRLKNENLNKLYDSITKINYLMNK